VPGREARYHLLPQVGGGEGAVQQHHGGATAAGTRGVAVEPHPVAIDEFAAHDGGGGAGG
jgi:hypothetical protein